MQNRTKPSSNVAKGLATLLCILGITSALVIPAAAGATSSIAEGMSLVFSTGQARSVADNLAVPVECVGDSHGFCSGNVTLSRNGHRISIPFSVRGGGHDVLFVPLSLSGHANHPRKVHGVATTVQPLGPATDTKEFLYAE